MIAKKKFTNRATTGGSGLESCVHRYPGEAAKRLTDCNNASELGESPFQSNDWISLFSSCCPIRPIPTGVGGLSLLCECFFRPVIRRETQPKAHVVTITLATQVTRKAEKVASWLTRLARKLRVGFLKKHDSHQTVSCFLAPIGSSFSCPSRPVKVQLFSLGFWWDLQSKGRDALMEGEYRTV